MGSREHMHKIYEGVALLSIWSSKGPKVTLRRWFSWLQAIRKFMGSWHSMLLALCFAGLQTGRFTKNDLPILNKFAKPDVAEGQGAPTSVGDEALCVFLLCGGVGVFGVLVYGAKVCRRMHRVGRPMSTQIRDLASCSATCFVGAVCGGMHAAPPH